MQVILFNGPKRAGKDVSSDIVCAQSANYPHLWDIAEQDKFAAPIFRSIPRIFSIDYLDWDSMYENAKEEPSDKLMGMSPRQAMIWLSEDVMKPKFGQDFYGKVTANKMKDVISLDEEAGENSLVVWSDCGFPTEVQHVIDVVGKENCFLVRLERDGCSFVRDSRSYIDFESLGLDSDNFFLIENNGSLDDLSDKIGYVTEVIAEMVTSRG